MVEMSSNSVSSTVMSKASSRAMTNSTRSRLSASRSSANLASLVILSAGTWSTSTAHSRNFSNAASLSTMCSLFSSFIETLQAHAEAAVNGYDSPGDIGRRIGGQKPDHAGHVVDRTGSPQWDLRGHLGQAVLPEGGRHVGLDEPGRHHIDGDLAAAHLTGHGACHADQTRLRGGVVGLTR